MATLVRPIEPTRSSVNRKGIGIFFLITGLMSAGLWWWNKPMVLQNPAVASAKTGIFKPLKISYTIEQKKLTASVDTSRATTQLLAKIIDKFTATTGEYSLYVYRLSENTGYGVNVEAIMPAASTMKVPIMQATFDNLDLTTQYTLVDEDKRSGSGPIEFMDAGTVLTVQQILQEMGQKSDNSAPVILTKLLPVGSMKKTFAKLGMTKTNFDDNTTTAYDLSMMWKYLYKNHSELMWQFLQDSIYEDRLSKGIPENITVIHKVGSGEGVWADTGIILGKKPLVITILNKDIDLDEAKKLVPEITKMIWNYESTR